jgi:hypothetical protein
MTNYLFQTSEFGVSDKGIHLLRSGFNYETIHWKEIDAAKIEKGRELRNWLLVFILGAALLALGLYLSYRTVDVLGTDPHPERLVKMLQFTLIPFIGAYFVYTSLRTGALLRISYQNKRDTFLLKELAKQERLGEFKSLLNEKLSIRVR